MATLHQLLKVMVEKGASDLHVTVGSPPQLRIDGSLVPLKTNPLTASEARQLCYSVLTDTQKQRFETHNELDLSFGVKGLSRFRGNVFVQRGTVAGVFRTIPFEILSFEKLGLPPVVRTLAERPPRPDPGHRRHRLRQIHHARLDHRQDQPREAPPHHDRRRPHRVPPPPQKLRGQPEGGGRRHHGL